MIRFIRRQFLACKVSGIDFLFMSRPFKHKPRAFRLELEFKALDNHPTEKTVT